MTRRIVVALMALIVVGCASQAKKEEGFYRLNEHSFPIYCPAENFCVEPSEQQQFEIIEMIVQKHGRHIKEL